MFLFFITPQDVNAHLFVDKDRGIITIIRGQIFFYRQQRFFNFQYTHPKEIKALSIWDDFFITEIFN